MDYEEGDLLDSLNADDWFALFNTSSDELEATEDDVSDATLGQIFQCIQQYLPPIQFILSSFGNIFAILIMSRLKNKVHQLCSYLIIVAVMDFAVIFWVSGNDWLMRSLRKDYITDYMNNSDICCKVITFFDHLFLHLSVWTTMTVCIEHVFFQFRPVTVRHFSSQRITDVICLLLVLVMCFNLHYFWTYGVIAVEFDFAIGHVIRNNYCFFLTKTLKGTEHQTDGFVWRVLDMVLVEYVPVVIVIVCMTLICLVRRGKIEVNSAGQRVARDKEVFDSQAFSDLLSGALTVVAWALPVTFLPKMIVQLLDKEDSISAWSLVSAVVKEWKLLFFSCKFYIYLACSAKVRQEFCLILSPLLKKGSQVISRIRITYESCSLRLRGQRPTQEGPIELPMDWEAGV